MPAHSPPDIPSKRVAEEINVGKEINGVHGVALQGGVDLSGSFSVVRATTKRYFGFFLSGHDRDYNGQGNNSGTVMLFLLQSSQLIYRSATSGGHLFGPSQIHQSLMTADDAVPQHTSPQINKAPRIIGAY